MKKHIHHLHIFILGGLVALALILLLSNIYLEKLLLANPPTFGVSFDPFYAKELGVDPKNTYISILKDLRVKNLRLNANWDQIEPFDSERSQSTQGKPFQFEELDWYMDQAQKHHAKAILGIGYKLPRWPECRAPKWLNAKDLKLRQERQLIMLGEVIRHFEDSPTIIAWQLENEPLLQFGICPQPDRDFFTQEVQFVRKLTKKPIIITDSGELRFWVTPMRLSDIFGTTLYRVVDTPWFGPFQYPLRPWFYRLKSDLVRKVFAPNNQKTIISELQAESWAAQPLPEVAIDEQLQRFSSKQFKETVEFARKTGFEQAYLWGTEWWYYLAKNGHPEYLEYARSLF